MGRVKIPLHYRTDSNARRVTLCKRKKGLYKKAEEIAKLCGVEVAVVIVGDTCKPSQYVATGSAEYQDLPSTYRVLSKYSKAVRMEGGLDSPAEALGAVETMENQQRQLETQRREIEELTRRLEALQQNLALNQTGQPKQPVTPKPADCEMRLASQTASQHRAQSDAGLTRVESDDVLSRLQSMDDLIDESDISDTLSEVGSTGEPSVMMSLDDVTRAFEKPTYVAHPQQLDAASSISVLGMCAPSAE